MADIRPFAAIRPSGEKASQIAALPYDVFNRKEAKWEIEGKPLSFLRIDRPETGFPDGIDMYQQYVYDRAHDLLWNMVEQGDFVTEQQPCYYIYELTRLGRVQDGLVACVSIDDYCNGIVKRHENTRQEKEEDRIRHIETCEAQTGPVFLAYHGEQRIRDVIALVKQDDPLYDFCNEDGIRHRVFRVAKKEYIDEIQETFAGMNRIYIADGHHRGAAAVKVGLKRRNQKDSIRQESDYFLSVLFAQDQLQILDYNRVVKDLHGNTPEEFLQKVREVFKVEPAGEEIHPRKKGEFTMYLEGIWYRCFISEEQRPFDPVEGLDVSVLQAQLLNPILGILEPRTDERIGFVGGIRGLKELERRVSEDCKVAFALYPTSMEELFKVADAGLLMPPKSTWFEPKLRSGLFIHKI